MSDRQTVRLDGLEHEVEVRYEDGVVYTEVDGNVSSVFVAALAPNPEPEILTPDTPPADEGGAE